MTVNFNPTTPAITQKLNQAQKIFNRSFKQLTTDLLTNTTIAKKAVPQPEPKAFKVDVHIDDLSQRESKQFQTNGIDISEISFAAKKQQQALTQNNTSK